MQNLKAPRIVLPIVAGVLVFLVAPASAGLRGKIQQKLNAPTNIQYEPYYLEQNAPEKQDAQMMMPQGGRTDNEAAVQTADYYRPVDNINPIVSRYAIYQTDYKAELEENVVTVKGKAVFQVFEKGWTQIPLVKTDVGLLDVSVNKGVAFVTMRDGQYFLMIDKPGKYILNIEFLIKAARERERGPGSFRFDVMSAPISQFEFTIVEKDVEIFVEPAIKVEIKKEADKTIAWAIMPNTTSIMTRWSKELPKEEITPVKLEPKVYADSATYAAIGEGIIRCQTQVNYSILQSEITSIRMSLPKDVSLLDVVGDNLRDWKVSEDENTQYLDVYLNFGVKGSYQLNLVYERNIGEGSGIAELPTIKSLGVERESGFLGIAAKTNVELAVNASERVTPIDVKDLPGFIWQSSANPLLLAFKYLNTPYSIAIEVTRHEELPVLVATIDLAQYVTLYTDEGKVLTKATYHVRNNVKQFLRLVLPPSAELWSSFVAGNPVKPAHDKEGHVLIPLEKSQMQGESLTHFPVEIVYLGKASAIKKMGGLKLNLPQTDIPVSSLQWSVYLPYDYSYFGFQGDVKEQKYFNQMGMAQRFAPTLQTGTGGMDTMKSVGQMADQYAPAVAREELSKASQTDYWGGSNSRMGILPIKIDVPSEGQTFYFSKLLVTEKESPWMSARYVGVPKFLRGVARLITGLGFLFVAAVFFKRITRKRKNAV